MVLNTKDRSSHVEAQMISMIQFHIASNRQFFLFQIILNQITCRATKYVNGVLYLHI